MTSIHLVPLVREHLDNFEPGVPDRAAFAEPYWSILSGYWVGRATCALGDGEVLGIAGVSLSDGCAYPWMVLSEAARRSYPIHLTRLARRFVDSLFKIAQIDRIEVHVDRDFLAAHRWIRHLGFREEQPTLYSMRYVRYGLTRASYYERISDDFDAVESRCA